MLLNAQNAVALLAVLSSIASVAAVPAHTAPISTVKDQGNTRYQSTEKVNPKISNADIRTKNQEFHQAANAEHVSQGKNPQYGPGMSSAQLKGDTLYHSTTANGQAKKPTLNPAYQATSNAHGGCKHNSNGKCSEGGTTSMVMKVHGNDPAALKGNKVSSYGTATVPGSGSKDKVTGHHPGCTGRNGQIGCGDVIAHNGMTDINKKPAVPPKPAHLSAPKVKPAVPPKPAHLSTGKGKTRAKRAIDAYEQYYY
jgi:hypothetical protein